MFKGEQGLSKGGKNLSLQTLILFKCIFKNDSRTKINSSTFTTKWRSNLFFQLNKITQQGTVL